MMEQSVTELKAMVESLELQLVDLYRERSEHGSPNELRDAVKNLEAQLCDLYAERAESPMSAQEAQAAIESLEAQVVSLVDEKMHLESRMAEIDAQMGRLKHKSKALGAAILEAALFGPEGETVSKSTLKAA